MKSAHKPQPKTNDLELAHIPEQLKKEHGWVNWRLEQRDGKPAKVPVDPRTGKLASCRDPNTWGTFAQAVKRLGKGGVSGIGFQLKPPFVGVDLDLCRSQATGEVEPWAEQIVDSLDSYSELSPSGQGIHVLVKGALPKGRRRKGRVEMYDRDRYFTLTGEHIKSTPLTINKRSSALKVIYREIFGKPTVQKSAKANHTSGVSGRAPHTMTDAELIERARNAENGAKFSRLWAGDFSDYASQSEADLALCRILTFWTRRDVSQMDRVFRQSALFRDKWDEPRGEQSYGQLTIDKAVQETSQIWDGGGGDGAGTKEAPPESLPMIVVRNRQLREVTDLALSVLSAANQDAPVIFVRGRALVRLQSDETGRTTIEPLGVARLRARLTQVCDTVFAKGESYLPCFPPRELVENLLALGQWKFPALENICDAPVLRPDGTVLTKPGYDPATKLFYTPLPGLVVPEIPAAPTRLDIAAALDLLEDAVGQFPWADDTSKANALGLMLTPILRNAISGPTPLALIDAPQPGTGKSLLTELTALVITGRCASMMAAPRDDEEWRKRITAVLSTGTTLIAIDNVERPLESASLAICLTAQEWTDRLLGLSRTITIPIRVTWLATGNNIKLAGDMPRRCYWIRLDAKTSQPWKRTGFKHPNLLSWAREQRGQLLAALLTLAAAWYSAGRPAANVPTMGGFDAWAGTIGGVLQHAGVKGFLGNLEELYEAADESTPQWAAFLGALRAAFADHTFTVREVINGVTENPNSPLAESLPDELAEVVQKHGSLQRCLGRALAKRVGTRYGDGDAQLHLERAGQQKHATLWKVVEG